MGTKRHMMRALQALAAVAVPLLGTASGCGAPLDPAGTSCSVDDECAAGLSCRALASAPGADCRILTNVCSKACRGDADCSAVAPGFTCYPACEGEGTCARTN